MGKTRFYNALGGGDVIAGNQISFRVPDNYMVASFILEITGTTTVVNQTVNYRPGGLHNLVQKLELIVDGSNTLFSMPGVFAAHMAGIELRENVDKFVRTVQVSALADKGTVMDGSDRSHGIGVKNFTVRIPITMASYNMQRFSDTLFNSNRQGSTVYLNADIIGNYEDIFIENGDDVTFSNVQYKVVIDQFLNYKQNRENIPVLGDKVKGVLTYNIDAANNNRITEFPTAPAYVAFVGGLHETEHNTPVTAKANTFAMTVNSFATRLAQQEFQHLYPKNELGLFGGRYGAWEDSTDASAYFPLYFPYLGGASYLGKYSDSFITADSNNINIRTDHVAKDKTNLSWAFVQLRPFDVQGFLRPIFGLNPAA